MEKNQEKKLTINKVAELCGVSKTTISRYLNGKYDNMSPDTKERIATVIAGLDYHPDRTAQRLKSQKSMLIGCVIADAGSPFSAILLKGISNCLEQSGYQVMISDSRENPAKERRAIQGFLESRVDGLLINTTGENDDLLREIKNKVPVVLVDRLVNSVDFDYVSSPNYETAYKITKLLFEMGYQNVTVISEKLRSITPRVDRYRGYCAAMAEEGITPSIYEISEENSTEGCKAFLARFTEENKGKRTAMLCSNGVAALPAVLAAFALKLNIGYDFGCCTFDDWNWLQLAKPSISAIQLGTEEKGTEAAKLLLQRIDNSGEIGEEPKHIIVDSTMILRSSTVSTKI